MYILPWTTPAPIGIVLGCGLGLLCVLYVLCALLMDFLIYYPFFRVYDGLKVQEEDEASDVQNEEELLEVNNEVVDQKRILVLCAGGGTSGLLAHALDEGAKEKGIKLTTAAGAYGAHYDMLKNFDLVILAPQVANNLEDLKKDTDRLHIKCTACQSKQYIGLTRDPQKALEFVFSILNNEGGNA